MLENRLGVGKAYIVVIRGADAVPGVYLGKCLRNIKYAHSVAIVKRTGHWKAQRWRFGNYELLDGKLFIHDARVQHFSESENGYLEERLKKAGLLSLK